jgi:hypothetical protein
METNSQFKKEYLVVLPLFGTTLAVSFDVGYFGWLDFDLFNVFSVSEHIAFAMQLVPFIVVASMIMIVSSITESMLRRGQTNRRRTTLIALSGLVIVVFGSVCFYIFNATGVFMAFCIGVGFIAILLVILIMLVPRIFAEENILVLAAASLLLVSSLVLGVDTARQSQNSHAYKYLIQTTDDGEITARILRSGDRGLLVSTPDGIMLLPWKQIQLVSEKGSKLELPP